MIRNLFTHCSKKIFHFLILLLFITSMLFSPFGKPIAYAMSAPTPLAPANHLETTVTNYPPLGIPDFSWTAVEGAANYHIQFSPNIGFSTVAFEITTALTDYTPTNSGPFPDGDIYWRVKVESPTASDYSLPMHFHKTWASLTNTPVLSSPADGDTLHFYDSPTFSWQAVMGAALYRFQIAASPDGFGSPLENLTTLTLSIQPVNKLSNGTYYWRVLPIDPSNREGTPSQVRQFILDYDQVPTSLEPSDHATPTFTPTFRWTAVRGAQFYTLQYSTDPDLNNNVITEYTRNTTFTPTNPLPNDVNYYWRVRAHSGNSVSDWSYCYDPINGPHNCTFVKKWYIKPTALTPTNNYAHVRFPFTSWTPVPGASYYEIEFDDTPDFLPPYYYKDTTSNTSYATPRDYFGYVGTYYWRVTPFDKNNNAGKSSNLVSFKNSYTFTTPSQVYPLYYYSPRSDLKPHEDRTVPLPIFMWHRLTNPYPAGGTFPGAYRLQVSSDPLFMSVDWSVDTENQSAAPTIINNFTPVAGVDYYWRVHALDQLGGNLIGDGWSQVWRTRIDLSKGLTPTTGNVPLLLRPARASEIVESTPLLEWWPLQGASKYQVQISDSPIFSPSLVTSDVTYPAYTPIDSLAQRSLGHINFGTYYWRVRAYKSSQWTGWSDTWRFQIAAQSEWIKGRSIGDASNRLLIGTDPVDTADNNYELTTLNVAQDIDDWYFGFKTYTGAANKVCVLYLDIDNLDNSGADIDARGYNITTIPAHRPEFAIYIFQNGGNFSADQVAIYPWMAAKGNWGTPQWLNDIAGDLIYTGSPDYYLEIRVPNTAIGYDPDRTSSYSLSLFSVPTPSGSIPVDSVPSDPDIPGSGPISRFASVSERMNVLMPPNAIEGDPSTFASIPPYFWDYPTGAAPYTPWAGVYVQTYKDPQFTTPAQNGKFELVSNTPYYASTFYGWPIDFEGDNTYYWRIRPRYLDTGYTLGAWTQGTSFNRAGFVPEDLQVSVTFATPTFSWSMAEGAEAYEIAVDGDINFGSPDIYETTSQTSFTSRGTLANGVYYWRVRARRWGNVFNNWSPTQNFTLSLPVPGNLRPDDPDPMHAVRSAPTLCWDPVLVSPPGGQPVLAAYRYRLQVSSDATFSNIVDQLDTEQSCWTPTRSYEDRTYYWRVAMLDGDNKMGDYSPAATFTKQYPRTTLVSPANGGSVGKTPTFIWTPVNGAARYKIEISKDAVFSNKQDELETNNTKFTPTRIYDLPQYWWRVAIIDYDGKYGPFNSATLLMGANNIFIPLLKK